MANRSGPLSDSDLLHEGAGFDSPAMHALALEGAERLPGGKPAKKRFGLAGREYSERETRDNARPIAPGDSARRLQDQIDEQGAEPMDARDAFGFGDDAQSALDAEFGDMERTPAGQAEGGAMTEDELVAFLEMEERDAVDYIGSTTAHERAQALDYYFGQPFGNEVEGESQVVSTDVHDTVEGLLPGCLKPFVSSDDVAKFNPISAKDRKASEQEGAYVTHVLMQKNPGYSILRAAMWDGLAQKNGIVTYWWDEQPEVTIERYRGLTDMQVTQLLQDYPDVEVTEHREYVDPAHTPPPAAMPAAQAMSMGLGPNSPPPGPQNLHDLTIRIREGYGCARVENVPSEEFLIARNASSANPKAASFVGRRQYMTLSKLRALVKPLGIEVDDDLADFDADYLAGTPEFLSRRTDDPMIGTNGNNGDPSMREVLVRDLYPLLDFDGDGIAERRRVLIVGRKVFINMEVEEAPFCGWTPTPIPHRFFGLSAADVAMDTQLIKSTIKRQVLNNFYGINNNRVAISERVDIDDLLDNAIGGAVRVNTQGQPIGNDIMPMPVQPIGAIAQPLIDYLDREHQNRVGFSPASNGSSPDSIKKPVSATEAQQISDNSHERQDLICREFAETFLKPLCISLHGLLRRNATARDTFELNGEWIDVDPRIWITRRHMTVSVGLGTGDRQAKLQGYQLIGQAQQLLAPMGLVGPEHAYATFSKICNIVGEKDVSQFARQPQPGEQPKPPTNPQVEVQNAANQGIIGAEQVKADGSLKKADKDNEARLNETLIKCGFEALMQVSDQNAEVRLLILKNVHDMRAAMGLKQMDANLAPAHQKAIADHRAPPKDNVLSMPGVSPHGPRVATPEPAGGGAQMQQMTTLLQQLLAHAQAPKQVVRDPSGRVVGVQPMTQQQPMQGAM